MSSGHAGGGASINEINIDWLFFTKNTYSIFCKKYPI